jgi:hypothetical protein
LEIKIGSPAQHTFVAHCVSQYVGYLPTREAFKRGGHEVDFSYWAKMAPEALEIVVQNAVGLLKELFQMAGAPTEPYSSLPAARRALRILRSDRGSWPVKKRSEG